ncbi:hypothetical protein BsIDN1_58310 [Bacillus safensis]|uniref:Signal transduction response regulator propionate catabolism activator N-terminal domain-containing protein n=1 Tax=Bacillus safensis TaxID=561879 RepID=A0A5S9MGK2_BACIA|nr:hypothetical protein BsIDN1_58310 [Bacillus safensis]
MGVLFMNIKVLGVAPYKGLGDVLIDLAKEEENMTFQLVVGDLRSGVALAEQAEAQGMDIIMSRGGTAALIQKHVNIPVVDIPVSGYDLLRALTLIKKIIKVKKRSWVLKILHKVYAPLGNYTRLKLIFTQCSKRKRYGIS